MTVILAGGGVSWFFTPSLNLPSTSYLDIEASCTNNPFQLEIDGSSDRYIYKRYFIYTDTGYFITHDS